MKKESITKERMHAQMTAEMKQGARTDTIVVITTIFLNLLFLAINSGVASAVRDYEYTRAGLERTSLNVTALVIMVLLLVVVIAINFFVLRILSRGKERRIKLMAGLI